MKLYSQYVKYLKFKLRQKINEIRITPHKAVRKKI
jgi:hypothetical protein